MSADDDVLRAMGLLNIDINDRQQVEGVCRRLLGRVWVGEMSGVLLMLQYVLAPSPSSSPAQPAPALSRNRSWHLAAAASGSAQSATRGGDGQTTRVLGQR